MAELTKTMKLHIHPNAEEKILFENFTVRYTSACDAVSVYVFGK